MSPLMILSLCRNTSIYIDMQVISYFRSVEVEYTFNNSTINFFKNKIHLSSTSTMELPFAIKAFLFLTAILFGFGAIAPN